MRAQVTAVVAFDQRVIQAATDYTRDHPGLEQALLVWQAPAGTVVTTVG